MAQPRPVELELGHTGQDSSGIDGNGQSEDSKLSTAVTQEESKRPVL